MEQSNETKRVNRPSAAGDVNSNSSLSARQAAAEAEIQQAIENGKLDPTKVFTGEGNIDAAAKEALTVVHPISEKYQIEIGGRIVPNGEGVSYEIPYAGDTDGVDINPTGAVAGYHTHHGGIYFQYFSNIVTNGEPADAEWVKNNHIPLYMSNFNNNSLKIRVCEGGLACNTFSNLPKSRMGRLLP